MKKFLAGGIGIALALMVVFGSGNAAAINEYVGMTYAKASESISKWGTPVISSREGSYLPTDKCIVVGSKMASFLDSSGRKQGGKVLLDINCNDQNAYYGHPGNSVTTPDGKAASDTRDTARKINRDVANATAAGTKSWCEKNADKCKAVCDVTGLCSDEVEQLLGM